MKLRDPKDILHKGVRLSDALPAHGRWLAGENDGEQMNWSGANIAGANMADAYMARANMFGADMTGAYMAGADMTCAYMAGANMRDANMAGANMRDANMAGANMARANMVRANMTGAYMARANMTGANMTDAYIAGANMADAYMARANMARANMTRANMARANMVRANMAGAIGNMREVKSAQFDQWLITWTTAPDGKITLQIGCQRHPLSLWEKSDPRWIEALDPKATEWWAKYREVVLALVKASPATPYGKESK